LKGRTSFVEHDENFPQIKAFIISQKFWFFMTDKNREVKLVKHQEISQTKKGHWVFHETARKRTLLCKMSFSNVETRVLYAPCSPSTPIQEHVMQVRRFRPFTS
jgi:hypothetical protein